MNIGRQMSDEELFSLLLVAFAGATAEGVDCVSVNIFYIREMLFRLNPANTRDALTWAAFDNTGSGLN